MITGAAALMLGIGQIARLAALTALAAFGVLAGVGVFELVGLVPGVGVVVVVQRRSQRRPEIAQAASADARDCRSRCGRDAGRGTQGRA
ncbi:hypothetical protein LAUMK41_04862 [Mycobacterium attenuatum]|nr:hypothetical protein LAUMK41_04862 [Mycobacterium attenuatum]